MTTRKTKTPAPDPAEDFRAQVRDALAESTAGFTGDVDDAIADLADTAAETEPGETAETETEPGETETGPGETETGPADGSEPEPKRAGASQRTRGRRRGRDLVEDFLDGRTCSPRHVELARQVQARAGSPDVLHPEAAIYLNNGLG